MSIGFYQRNRGVMHVLSVVLVTLMLMSCLSPALIQSARAEALVGLSLIAAILGSFGISAVASGTVEGMLDGLEGLMQDFSESLGHTRDWFRSLFDSNTFVSSYGRLGIAGTLVDTIKLFISWLKSEHSLSLSNPIVFSEVSSVVINGINYYAPDFSNVSVSIPAGVSGTYYIGGGHSYRTELDGNRTRIYHLYNGTESAIYTLGRHRDTGVYYEVSETVIYFYIAVFNERWFERQATVFSLSGNISGTVSGDSWAINDDNLDLDYLDNDDGSTKDVIFSPSIPLGMTDNPDFVMPSLGDISGFNDLTGDILDYNKATSLTEEGTVTGELETSQEFQPGDPDVPSISIPAGGWFLSIWHYVVQALQDSAAGIAFIMTLLRTAIPPAILNLAWAACVLLITFGILNKFLK